MNEAKIGAIIIHSEQYTERYKNVKTIKDLFENSNVELNIISGVFTDKPFYDVRYPGKFLSKGNIGCSLAHLNALKLAIDKGYDKCFFFEDDARAVVSDYSTLMNWINAINVEYDLLLLTNVGIYTGKGHDERDHYLIEINEELNKCSCAFSTAAYYADKNIIKTLFKHQINAYINDKLYIADGLHIHCEKGPFEFLNIITPKKCKSFFDVDSEVISILNTIK